MDRTNKSEINLVLGPEANLELFSDHILRVFRTNNLTFTNPHSLRILWRSPESRRLNYFDRNKLHIPEANELAALQYIVRHA